MKLFIVLILSLLGLISVQATRRPPFCTDDYWQNCLGNGGSCWPCYDRNCAALPCLRGNYRNTVEKTIVQELNDIILARNYPLAGPIFAEDAIVRVPSFQITLQGREAIILYLYLGDPAVSDQYVLLYSSFFSSVQELNTVTVEVNQTLQSVRPPNFSIFSPYATWKMTFNDNNQIQEWVVGTDSLLLYQNLAGQLNLDIPSLCATIQDSCQGSNQQYADQAECEAYMNSIPLQPMSPSNLFIGNTVTCRSFHSELFAGNNPQAELLHCPHTGQTPSDPISTPCFDWLGPAKKRAAPGDLGTGKVLKDALDWWCANGEAASHLHGGDDDHKRHESETEYCFTLDDAGDHRHLGRHRSAGVSGLHDPVACFGGGELVWRRTHRHGRGLQRRLRTRLYPRYSRLAQFVRDKQL